MAAGLPGIQNFVRYANLVLPVSEIEADPLLPDPRYHEQFAQPQDHAYRNTEDKDAPRGTARKRRAVDISPHCPADLGIRDARGSSQQGEEAFETIFHNNVLK